MEFTCIVIDDERHVLYAMTDVIAKYPKLKLVKTFSRAQEALDYLETTGGVDFIFSDIQMPDMSGLTAAKYYHQFCKFLVFATADARYSEKVFEANAELLLKPVFFQKFEELIDKLISQML